MTRSRPGATRRVAALLAALALACAGCGADGGEVDVLATPSGVVPLPEGAGALTAPPSSAAVPDCGDPTASLRPQGALPAPGALPPDSTMARIRGRGKLIVGVNQNTYQMGYRNPATGTVEGFDIDMAKQVAAAIFGTPDAIQLKILNSAQRIPALQKGEVDIVVNTMTINCERLADVAFSSVYYEAGQRVLVKSGSDHTGIESLGGKPVCAAKGSTSLRNIANAASKPVPVQVADWTDCLVLLQQNQVEAVSTDDTILAGLKAQDPLTRIVGAPIDAEPYGMAMRKDQPDLVRFVNAVLERVRADGTWTTIYGRWLAALLDEPVKAPPQARYRD